MAADGSILDVRTIQAMGVLTDVSVAAVRKWKFTPAEDARGVKEASHAYAVFVYRFPVIEQEEIAGLVDDGGIEPPTSALRTRRSPS